MKGYDTQQQYTNDYKLYLAAKEVDPGRDQKPTLTAFFKKRIHDRFTHASKRFKNMLAKNNYTEEDLQIITVHQISGHIQSLDQFAQQCYGTNVSERHYKKILTSNAFKKGSLKKLYSHIPPRILNKQELKQFIRRSFELSDNELKTIMRLVAAPEWRTWFEELVEEGYVGRVRGVWR